MKYWSLELKKQSIYGGVTVPLGHFIIGAESLPDLTEFLASTFEEGWLLHHQIPIPIDHLEESLLDDRPLHSAETFKVWRVETSDQ